METPHVPDGKAQSAEGVKRDEWQRRALVGAEDVPEADGGLGLVGLGVSRGLGGDGPLDGERVHRSRKAALAGRTGPIVIMSKMKVVAPVSFGGGEVLKNSIHGFVRRGIVLVVAPQPYARVGEEEFDIGRGPVETALDGGVPELVLDLQAPESARNKVFLLVGRGPCMVRREVVARRSFMPWSIGGVLERWIGNVRWLQTTSLSM